LKLWDDERFEELITEAEICERKRGKSVNQNMTDSDAHLVFSRLILQGKIREATRFITQRGEKTGILRPEDTDGKGNMVIDVLNLKHPAQAEPNPDAFQTVEELPCFIDIDVTAGHVEKVAKKLSGAAGISGLDSMTWQAMLSEFW
jgi:hypothetical protein